MWKHHPTVGFGPRPPESLSHLDGGINRIRLICTLHASNIQSRENCNRKISENYKYSPYWTPLPIPLYCLHLQHQNLSNFVSMFPELLSSLTLKTYNITQPGSVSDFFIFQFGTSTEHNQRINQIYSPPPA